MSENNESDRIAKSSNGLVTESKQKRRGVADIRHWEQRITKQKHKSRGGVTTEDKTYSIRLSNGGQQKTIQLGISNTRAAAKLAKEIAEFLKPNGWEKTLEKYGRAKSKPDAPGGGSGRVGDLLRVYGEIAKVPAKTKANYARVFRTMVADIKKIPGGKKRFDYVNGGAEKWRAKVDAVKLSDITPGKISKWQEDYLEKRASNPLEETSVKRTINSYIRYGKSLFSKDVINHLGRELALPSPLPFDGVTFYPRELMRYKSTFDAQKLILEAREELPGIEDDQQWLILILAIAVGMRRNEIDKLTWRQVDLQKMEIDLSATEYFKPKSKNSGTVVAIDSDLANLLERYKPKAKETNEFVITSNVPPNLKGTVAHYRANRHFKALIKWLKKKGVKDRKPIHALRKEAGSLVNTTHGLHASSLFLRHSDIQVTAAHYVNSKEVITSGFGGLISGKVDPIDREKIG